MDLGTVTLIVAVAFAGAGIVVGILISKFLSKKEPPQPDLTGLTERVEGIADRISLLIEKIDEKLETLRADQVGELRKEVDGLISEVERLKKGLLHLDVTESSISALEKTRRMLEELEFNLPRIDESLLVQVKDNLLILRNDVENLLKRTKENRAVPGVDVAVINSVLDSINTAVELAKKLNASLVKGELAALAGSIKNEELSSLVKDLDLQSLNSKELVVLLEEVRKKLEGVRDETSLRG